MNNNQAKRDLALQFVRFKTFSYEGLTVNRSHCAQLDKSDELQYLLKKGLVERKRVLNSRRTTYTVLVPADGVTQSHVPVCALCRGAIPYMIGTTGHAAGCAGVIEDLTPTPTWAEKIETRKAIRLSQLRALQFQMRMRASA
jgi:hypothetical protein